MNKKQIDLSIDEITQKEIMNIDSLDKLSKLEKERQRDKKIIAEYKEREKASARALVLYERKIKFLKDNLISNILSVCKDVGDIEKSFDTDSKEINDTETNVLSDLVENLSKCENNLYDICNFIEANAVITKKDRDFISNRKTEEKHTNNDIDSRFNRLKQEFAQKVGDSVLRKPGRPKKSEQSIVADIGLRKKVEKTITSNDDVENKLKDIFYATPSHDTVISSIPQTDDSVFDFNEALNPNVSLKDIMSDLMSDKEDEETKTYGNIDAQNIETIRPIAKSNKSNIELLESGIFIGSIRHKK